MKAEPTASNGRNHDREDSGTSEIVKPHALPATFRHSVPLVVLQSEGQISIAKSQQSWQTPKSRSQYLALLGQSVVELQLVAVARQVGPRKISTRLSN